MQQWSSGYRLNNRPYQIERVLGEGGFGITYKAQHLTLDIPVVIKTPNSKLQKDINYPKYVENFKREGKQLAQLGLNRHPHIVRVSDLFDEDNLPCIIMDFVPGESLYDLVMTQGALSEEKALGYIKQIGSALIVCHKAGIIHRDVHPNNILIRDDNTQAVLIDFGIAGTTQTSRNTHSGNRAFAPWEQLASWEQQNSKTPQVDIYTLAASLYFKEQPVQSFVDREPSQRKTSKPKTPPVNVTRRSWLKYSSLAIGAMGTAWIGKNIWENSQQQTQELPEKLDSSQKSNSATNTTPNLPKEVKNQPTLSDYKFDVITVNDRGEEIKREQGKAKYFTEDLGNGITLEIVAIPGGTFMMGAPKSEKDSEDDERPQHQVKVPAFYIGKFQVTQAQWKAIAKLPQVKRELKPDPSKFKGEKLPVERVSWYDAVEFCARLSKQTGKEYRLPSEAEWEYACRGGTKTPFHFGETLTSNLANYDGRDTYRNEPKGVYRVKTTEVGSFPPNVFGLYDMHGNVWEWCADRYHKNYQGAPIDGSAWLNDNDSHSRILRGGSWGSIPHYCRCAPRFFSDPDLDYGNDYGFRVVCSSRTF
jgi:formylglycine-generating enzyme required for sulfatase activity/tRNA A-37 threonylcarbamoyl transferase component Bud32